MGILPATIDMPIHLSLAHSRPWYWQVMIMTPSYTITSTGLNIDFRGHLKRKHFSSSSLTDIVQSFPLGLNVVGLLWSCEQNKLIDEWKWSRPSQGLSGAIIYMSTVFCLPTLVWWMVPHTLMKWIASVHYFFLDNATDCELLAQQSICKKQNLPTRHVKTLYLLNVIKYIIESLSTLLRATLTFTMSYTPEHLACHDYQVSVAEWVLINSR